MERLKEPAKIQTTNVAQMAHAIQFVPNDLNTRLPIMKFDPCFEFDYKLPYIKKFRYLVLKEF